MSAPGLPRDDAELRARLDGLLRRCIQCGLCLPNCATYLATGNEAQSPRGRLLLLSDLLAAPDRRPAPATLSAFDRCIGCRACVTACPSGVAFDLLEAVKARGHAARRRAGTGPLAWALGRPRVLTLLRMPLLARLARVVPRSRDDAALIRCLDARLAARRGCRDATGVAPVVPPSSPLLPEGAAPPRVVLFTGCANAGLLPHAQRRLRGLLAAAGCDVLVPPGQECCGALAAHAGQDRLAARQRRANATSLAPGAPDVIVAEAAGCGLELRHYPPAVAGRVRDAVVLLSGLALPPPRPVPLTVVYHDPCHARHGQGIVTEPRALLARIPGLTLVEPEEAEVCCGSGGPYVWLHPALSARMGARKAERLIATGADLVVTSNPGCQGQLEGALRRHGVRLPVVPLTDLLWFACLAP